MSDVSRDEINYLLSKTRENYQKSEKVMQQANIKLIYSRGHLRLLKAEREHHEAMRRMLSRQIKRNKRFLIFFTWLAVLNTISVFLSAIF